MTTLNIKKAIRALSMSTKLNTQGKSRITHCIDCNKKIPEYRLYQTDCKRCTKCQANFDKRKYKENER